MEHVCKFLDHHQRRPYSGLTCTVGKTQISRDTKNTGARGMVGFVKFTNIQLLFLIKPTSFVSNFQEFICKSNGA